MDQGFKPAQVPAHKDFLTGMREGFPLAIAAAPFGILFGAIAIDNGLASWEALLMSMAIYAGASQMVGLDLFAQRIAPWMIVFSIFAINFRHVLYSATIGRRIAHFSFWQKAVGFFVLVDTQFALTEQRAESGKRVTFAWYMGAGMGFYLTWALSTVIGVMFGNLITDPYALGIDFILPIYFLGMVMGFRRRQNWLPVVLVSAICAVAAYKFVGSPWHVSLGALGGIVVAAILAKPKVQGA